MFLVIDSDDEACAAFRRFLYANNILSVGYNYRDLPRQADHMSIDAVIIPNPYDKNMPTHFCYTCHTRFPKIPLMALKPSMRPMPPDYKAVDVMIESDLPPRRIIDTILLEASRYHGRDVAEHIVRVARDHILMDCPTWRGQELYLTPTERMIFRYLMNTYPRPVTATELMRYCIKPGCKPQLCIIPTHVYHINQKAKELFSTHIIASVGNSSYRLLFPKRISV